MNKIVHVKLYSTKVPSYINIYYSNDFPYINLYICDNELHQHLYRLTNDYISLIKDRFIINFDAAEYDIPDDIIQLFVNISYKQNQIILYENPMIIYESLMDQNNQNNQNNYKMEQYRINNFIRILLDLCKQLKYFMKYPDNIDYVAIDNIITQISLIFQFLDFLPIIQITNKLIEQISQMINSDSNNFTTLYHKINYLIYLFEYFSHQKLIYTDQDDSESEPRPLFKPNPYIIPEVIATNISFDYPIDNLKQSDVVTPLNHIDIFYRPTKQLSDEMIQMIANQIHYYVKHKNVKCPDFQTKTKSGYRKSKNFIYNITKKWLNPNEINRFVVEYQKLKNN